MTKHEEWLSVFGLSPRYLDWCLKETLRLAPPAPGIIRQSTEEQLIGGKWRMPAHMPVINIMALHYSAWDLNLETLLYSDASVSM